MEQSERNLCLRTTAFFLWMLSLVTTTVASNTERETIVVVAGVNQTLECRLQSKSKVRWEWTPFGSTSFIYIHNGNKLSNHVRSEDFDVKLPNVNDTTVSHLILLNVNLNHSGLYKCVNAKEDKTAREIEVQVLAAEPQCTTNVTSDYRIAEEYDFVGINCSVAYIGRWAPAFHCQPTTHHRQQSPAGSTALSIVSYEYVVKVPRSFNGKSLSCAMTFNRTNSSTSENAIPPASNYSWEFARLVVMFGPDSVRATENGSFVTCSADGNPRPNITWTDTNETNSDTLNVCNLTKSHQWMDRGLFGDIEEALEFNCTASRGNRTVTIKHRLKQRPHVLRQLCGLRMPTTQDGATQYVTETSEAASSGETNAVTLLPQPLLSVASESNQLVFVLSISLVGIVLLCGTVIIILLVVMAKRKQNNAVQSANGPPCKLQPSKDAELTKEDKGDLYDEINEPLNSREVNIYEEIPDTQSAGKTQSYRNHLNKAAQGSGEYAKLDQGPHNSLNAVRQPTSSSNKTYTTLTGLQEGCVQQNDAYVADAGDDASVGDSGAAADNGAHSTAQAPRYCSLHVSRLYEHLSGVTASDDGDSNRREVSDDDDDDYEMVDETKEYASLQRHLPTQSPLSKVVRREASAGAIAPNSASRKLVAAEGEIGHSVYGTEVPRVGRAYTQRPPVPEKFAAALYTLLLSDDAMSTAAQSINNQADHEMNTADNDETIKCNDYEKTNMCGRGPRNGSLSAAAVYEPLSGSSVTGSTSDSYL